MAAELEDTSGRRTQSLGAQLSETLSTAPVASSAEAGRLAGPQPSRPSYRSSLPAILDESYRRHMKTWYFDESTQTWRPHSQAGLRARTTRSHPNLHEHVSRGENWMPTGVSEKPDCSTVLLAELSTNVEVCSYLGRCSRLAMLLSNR